MGSAVVVVAVSGCVTNNPPMYCFYKTTICCPTVSEGQESGENLPELSGFIVSRELRNAVHLDGGSLKARLRICVDAVYSPRLAVAKAASGLHWPLV